MKTIRIECSKRRRLFDAAEGSKLRVIMKCGNAKVCPLKPDCDRRTDVVIGVKENTLKGVCRAVSCPSCDKRLFDVTADSSGFIAIKCDHCSKVSVLHIFAV